MTPAQKFVDDEMRAIFGKNEGYRTGALLLTYPSSKPETTCQIVMGAAIAKADADHALDFVMLVRGLRRLADELEVRVQGKVPLTQDMVDV